MKILAVLVGVLISFYSEAQVDVYYDDPIAVPYFTRKLIGGGLTIASVQRNL